MWGELTLQSTLSEGGCDLLLKQLEIAPNSADMLVLSYLYKTASLPSLKEVRQYNQRYHLYRYHITNLKALERM